MGSIMKRVKVLESTVNVQENSNEDSHTSARGEAKNSASVTAKHADSRLSVASKTLGKIMTQTALLGFNIKRRLKVTRTVTLQQSVN